MELIGPIALIELRSYPFIDSIYRTCDISCVFLHRIQPRCSVKKVFLNILQNSQENTCAEAFFNKVTRVGLKARLQSRCFSVNFAKCLRKFILQNIYE